METINKIEHWHKSRVGNGVFGIVELAIAYGFASWAIDTGSLWQYLFTIIFVVAGLRNLARIFKNNEQNRRTK